MLNGYNFHLFKMHLFHLVPEQFKKTLYSEECGTHPFGVKGLKDVCMFLCALCIFVQISFG